MTQSFPIDPSRGGGSGNVPGSGISSNRPRPTAVRGSSRRSQGRIVSLQPRPVRPLTPPRRPREPRLLLSPVEPSFLERRLDLPFESARIENSVANVETQEVLEFVNEIKDQTERIELHLERFQDQADATDFVVLTQLSEQGQSLKKVEESLQETNSRVDATDFLVFTRLEEQAQALKRVEDSIQQTNSSLEEMNRQTIERNPVVEAQMPSELKALSDQVFAMEQTLALVKNELLAIRMQPNLPLSQREDSSSLVSKEEKEEVAREQKESQAEPLFQPLPLRRKRRFVRIRSAQKRVLKPQTAPRTLNKFYQIIRTLLGTLEKFKSCHNECYKECHKECQCAEKIIEGVCNSIVGETWYKWDTTSKYYPAVTFLFLESTSESYPKRAQIKARFTSLPAQDNPSNEQLNLLRFKIESSFRDFEYTAGDFRCSFVSSHSSSWRTTLFAKDQNNAQSVLCRVLETLGEEYEDSCFSYTTPRVRSVNYLPDYPVDLRNRSANQNLSRQVLMHLHKAVLFCNGLPPVVLFLKSEVLE